MFRLKYWIKRLLPFFGERPEKAPPSSHAPDFSDFFIGKSFTSRFSPTKAAHWDAILPELRDKTVNILEIGSWEGRSAVFLLEYLPKSRITCIDTFEGSPENFGSAEDREITAAIEKRFDSNTASYGDRVRKIKSRSIPALDRLIGEDQSFDLIYIDGSHRRDDVLADTVLAWRLLKIGGILIWDDLTWRRHLPSSERPEHAITLFTRMFSSEVDPIGRTTGPGLLVGFSAVPIS